MSYDSGEPTGARPHRPSVILVAEESAGLRVLRVLDELGVELRGVLSDGSVGTLAEDLGYSVQPAARVRDPLLAEEIRGVDLLLNVHSLFIVADEILAAPRLGAFNLHPGPLPEYAGLNTPCWAIYEGAAEYGVSLHRMVTDIDAGDVVLERRWPLGGDETGLELYMKCSREGVELVKELMGRISSGEQLPARSQDRSRRRYYGREIPLNGRIAWSMPASKIERLVRASTFAPFPSPWGRPRVTVEGREWEVVEVQLLEEAEELVRSQDEDLVGSEDVEPTEPGAAVELGDGWFEVATGTVPVRVRVQPVVSADD